MLQRMVDVIIHVPTTMVDTIANVGLDIDLLTIIIDVKVHLHHFIRIITTPAPHSAFCTSFWIFLNLVGFVIIPAEPMA